MLRVGFLFSLLVLQTSATAESFHIQPNHLVAIEDRSQNIQIGVLVPSGIEGAQPVNRFSVRVNHHYRFEPISVPVGKLTRVGQGIQWQSYQWPPVSISNTMVLRVIEVFVEGADGFVNRKAYPIELALPVKLVLTKNAGWKTEDYHLDLDEAIEEAERLARQESLLMEVGGARHDPHAFHDEKAVSEMYFGFPSVADAFQDAFLSELGSQTNPQGAKVKSQKLRQRLFLTASPGRAHVEDYFQRLRDLVDLYIVQLEEAEEVRGLSATDPRVVFWAERTMELMEEIAVTLASFSPPTSFADKWRVEASTSISLLLSAGVAVSPSPKLRAILLSLVFLNVYLSSPESRDFDSWSDYEGPAPKFSLFDYLGNRSFRRVELAKLLCKEVRCATTRSKWRRLFRGQEIGNLQKAFALLFEAVRIASGHEISILVRDNINPGDCDPAVRGSGA